MWKGEVRSSPLLPLKRARSITKIIGKPRARIGGIGETGAQHHESYRETKRTNRQGIGVPI